MIIASLYHCPLDDAQIAHDMSCAIIKKNQIYAYEEEKLTSLKNESTVKFPEKSLLSGLKELNIRPDQVTDWVFPEPSKKIEINDFKLFFCDLLKATKYNSKKSFKKWFKKKVHFIPHHLSHASLAFYTSKFKSAAFLTKDGGGDLGDPRGFVFGEFNKNKMTIKRQSYSFKNLSLFHDYLTDALGFSYFSNGKTSGLAAYGKIRDELKKKFSSLLEVKNNGICFKCKRFKVSDVNIKKFKNHSYERYKVLMSIKYVDEVYAGKIPQYILTSATLPNDCIEAMTEVVSGDHVKILMGNDKVNLDAIKQFFVSGYKSFEDMEKFMTGEYRSVLEAKKIFIFCPRHEHADHLYKYMKRDRVFDPIVTIYHGKMTQEDREEAIRRFRGNKARILITTDLGARGLDIVDVDFVINCGLPTEEENYMHRIGRCGRNGREGIALNLVKYEDRLKRIQKNFQIWNMKPLPGDTSCLSK